MDDPVPPTLAAQQHNPRSRLVCRCGTPTAARPFRRRIARQHFPDERFIGVDLYETHPSAPLLPAIPTTVAADEIASGRDNRQVPLSKKPPKRPYVRRCSSRCRQAADTPHLWIPITVSLRKVLAWSLCDLHLDQAARFPGRTAHDAGAPFRRQSSRVADVELDALAHSEGLGVRLSCGKGRQSYQYTEDRSYAQKPHRR